MAKAKRPGVNLHIRERGGEWQILRGNKIVARCASEADADAEYRGLTGQPIKSATRYVEFSEGEIRFLMHRLEMWDCIADCFANSEGNEHSDDDVQVAALALITDIKTGTLDVADLTDCERDVLRDVIEGSTYAATTGGLDHPGAFSAAKRVARSAVAKLRAAGFECDDAPEA